MIRRAAATFTVSASLLVGVIAEEGMRLEAYKPNERDVWTIAGGVTRYEDGSPVQKGDTITTARAMELTLWQIESHAGAVQRCVAAPVTNSEYHALVDFAYNVGKTAFCSSTLVKKLNAGEYGQASDQFLRWVYAGGKDCRIAENNCSGIVSRRARLRAKFREGWS